VRTDLEAGESWSRASQTVASRIPQGAREGSAPGPAAGAVRPSTGRPDQVPAGGPLDHDVVAQLLPFEEEA